MNPTTHRAATVDEVRAGLPALRPPTSAAVRDASDGLTASAARASYVPCADYSLRSLRSTDTMGALDDSPAPVGQLFQEQLCMQRLLALMTHEIRWLRRSGARELDMILTPDQETRIAMHVVWSRGRFEAQARCHEGDYALINARWHELQYLLDGQGLSLGPLIPPPARVGFSEATGLPLTPALSASATFA